MYFRCIFIFKCINDLSSDLFKDTFLDVSLSASSGIDPFFRMGGGGVKVRKMPNFSARFARKVPISNFSRKARRKNENCVCLVVFLC